MNKTSRTKNKTFNFLFGCMRFSFVISSTRALYHPQPRGSTFTKEPSWPLAGFHCQLRQMMVGRMTSSLVDVARRQKNNRAGYNEFFSTLLQSDRRVHCFSNQRWRVYLLISDGDKIFDGANTPRGRQAIITILIFTLSIWYRSERQTVSPVQERNSSLWFHLLGLLYIMVLQVAEVNGALQLPYNHKCWNIWWRSRLQTSLFVVQSTCLDEHLVFWNPNTANAQWKRRPDNM